MNLSFIWDKTDLTQQIFGDGARVIAVAGAGGKSTLLAYVADKYASTPVLLTTTTRMAKAQRTLAASWQCIDEPWPEELSGPLLMIDRVEDNKLIGVDRRKVCQLARTYPRVVYEADGAAGGDLKCPGPHEPVIADCTDVMIVITSAQILGQPLDSFKIHRRQAFDAVISSQIQDKSHGRLTPKLMAALLKHADGAFRHCPPFCRRLWLLNKADACVRQPARLDKPESGGFQPGDSQPRTPETIRKFIEAMQQYSLNLDRIMVGSLIEGWFDRLKVSDGTRDI